MRLLLLQGNMVAVYENHKQLAVYAGADLLDQASAEQLRTARIDKIKSETVK